MTNETIHVTALFTALPQRIGDLRAVLKKLVEETRREPGCLQYDWLEETENPMSIAFIERWQSAAALEAHFQTPHFKEAIALMPPLLAQPVRILKLKQVM